MEDVYFVQKDFNTMKDMGFNVEELDIEGKNSMQIMDILRVKDIIYVEGGSAFYLIRVMRQCGFEAVIRKLLKEGIVYIGAGAGSIVAGKTIQTAEWTDKGDKFNIKDLRGLNILPFDVFVHYVPENAILINQKIPDQKKRQKDLKIICDGQALMIEGKDVDLIGRGESVCPILNYFA